ncbi:alpha/beta hydrolase [Nocardioides aquiterrae]|uniref:Alpha/beta fold hydrolase n=1 Tax=Nocardioides aquiterrae TaxID=203799 RepID=A0ABP4F109_9ACTN
MRVAHGRAALAVEQHGETGPDVLLLHAGVTDQRSWRSVVDRLAGSARCVSFDARGYGLTTYDREDGWSPVRDALAVLDAVGVEQAVVVACSMGGRTALDLSLAHPERVAGLVLIAPAISGAPALTSDDVDEPVRQLDELIDAADEAGDLVEVNRLEAHLWLDGPLEAEGRVAGAARELFLEMNGIALAAVDPGAQADLEPAWPRLGEIRVHTLVLVGEHDLRHFHDRARHLTDAITGAEQRILPGVAHLPHLEDDLTTLDIIEEFVTGGW